MLDELLKLLCTHDFRYRADKSNRNESVYECIDCKELMTEMEDSHP